MTFRVGTLFSLLLILACSMQAANAAVYRRDLFSHSFRVGETEFSLQDGSLWIHSSNPKSDQESDQKVENLQDPLTSSAFEFIRFLAQPYFVSKDGGVFEFTGNAENPVRRILVNLPPELTERLPPGKSPQVERITEQGLMKVRIGATTYLALISKRDGASEVIFPKRKNGSFYENVDHISGSLFAVSGGDATVKEYAGADLNERIVHVNSVSYVAPDLTIRALSEAIYQGTGMQGALSMASSQLVLSPGFPSVVLYHYDQSANQMSKFKGLPDDQHFPGNSKKVYRIEGRMILMSGGILYGWEQNFVDPSKSKVIDLGLAEDIFSVGGVDYALLTHDPLDPGFFKVMRWEMGSSPTTMKVRLEGYSNTEWRKNFVSILAANLYPGARWTQKKNSSSVCALTLTEPFPDEPPVNRKKDRKSQRERDPEDRGARKNGRQSRQRSYELD